MKKRLFGLFLILSVLSTMFTAIPATTSAVEDEVVLIDFTEAETISALNMGALTEDTLITAPGKAASAKWDWNKSVNSIVATETKGFTSTDWSMYQAVKISIYSSEATGERITVVPTVAADNLKSGYYIAEFKLDFTGWKDVVIPKASFEAKTNPGSFRFAGLQLKPAGWDTASANAIKSVVYLDSVSLITTDEITLLSFNNKATNKLMTFETDETAAAPQSAKSGKWVYADKVEISGYHYFRDLNGLTDWSAYKQFKIRMHSNLANDDHMTVVIPANDGGKVSTGGYFRYEVPIDWMGWRDVTINLSDFTATTKNGIAPTWEKATGIVLHRGKWSTNTDAGKGTILHFDSFSLVPKISGGVAMLMDFGDPNVAEAFLFEPSGDVRRGSETSAKWAYAKSPSDHRNYTYFTDNGLLTDWSAFSSINMWVYSECNTNDKASLVVSTAGGTNQYWIYYLDINWSGWKKITIPLSAFTPKKGANSWATITGMNFFSGDWSSANYNPETVLYLDRVWLDAASDSGESEGVSYRSSQPAAGTKDLSLSNRMFVLKYTSHLAAEIDESKITVTKNGLPTGGYHVGTYGKNLEVVFEDVLDIGASYQISIGDGAVKNIYGAEAKGAALTFETISSWISGIDLTLDSETGNAKVSVHTMGKDFDAALMLAVYEKNGKMKSVALNQREGTEVAQTLSVTLPIGTGETAKAMIFGSLEELRPLAPASEVTRASNEQLSLASVFADNAVLQRGATLPIWGVAPSDSEVIVTLDNKSYHAVADDFGKWSVEADAITVDSNPYTLTVTDGKDTITKSNILAGDVWLCSGQSNMAFKLNNEQNKDELLANAANENIRLFTQDITTALNGVQCDVQNGRWSECAASTAKNFSAVGYLFGKELQEKLGVPIGLIEAAAGGSAMEAWISKEHLISSGNGHLIDELRNGYICSSLYNAMLAPLAPYAMKGVIWYQGEANDPRHDNYTALSQAMFADWRDIWGADLPFIYAQIPKFGGATYPNLHYIREAQLKLLEVEDNAAMAVFTEAGDAADIHPTDKQTPAHRMALAALGMVYGENVEWKFPKAASKSVSGNTLTVTFDDVYSGLKAEGNITGFQLCGADGVYHDAAATICDTNQVAVTSELVGAPVGVRYGFVQCPEINLYNSAGLIASPFRMD